MMKFLAIIPRVLWKAWFLLNFITGLIILYPFFYVLLSREEWFTLAFRLKKFWARWILLVPGILVSSKRETDLNSIAPPVIFCANHVSYLDIVLSYIIIPHYFIFMGKQELKRAPLFNIFFKKMNILVDRQSRIGSHKAFLRATEEIDKGHSMFLFPEGTISSDAKLRPFKNGSFKLAIEKQIPIVPITFLNNWKILQNGGFLKAHGKPGIARVIVHKPIETKGMTEVDLASLREEVHHIISEDMRVSGS